MKLIFRNLQLSNGNISLSISECNSCETYNLPFHTECVLGWVISPGFCSFGAHHFSWWVSSITALALSCFHLQLSTKLQTNWYPDTECIPRKDRFQLMKDSAITAALP